MAWNLGSKQEIPQKARDPDVENLRRRE